MDYAELAKRARESWKRVPYLLGGTVVKFTEAANPALFGELADAIEALTSPPDEAQVEAAVQSMWGVEGLTASVTGAMRYEVRAALDAAYRVRVKK